MKRPIEDVGVILEFSPEVHEDEEGALILSAALLITLDGPDQDAIREEIGKRLKKDEVTALLRDSVSDAFSFLFGVQCLDTTH